MRFASRVVFLTALSLLAGLTLTADAGEPFALRQRIGSTGEPDRPESLRTIALSPDGRFAALAGEAATPTSTHIVQLRDVATGKVIHTLADHESVVRSVAFSADGDRLATVTRNDDGTGAVRVFDVETGRRTHQIEQGGQIVQFLPDGHIAATGFGELLVFDAATGREVERRETMPVVKDVSPDGGLAVGVSHHGANVLDVRDLDEGVTIVRLTGCAAEPVVAVFSPDGRTVAASDPRSKTVLVWEVLTGQTVQTLDAGAAITALAFTSDSRYLIAGGIGKELQAWEVATGSEAGRAATHEGAVTVLTTGPKDLLISGGTDRTAIVWSMANLNHSSLPEPPFTDADLDAAWDSLASPDARTAYRTLALISRNPSLLLPAVTSQVERQLLPIPAADTDRLVEELNDPDYRVRERATATLATAGDALRPQLERWLEKTDSPEVRARLRLLLDRSDRSQRFSAGDILRLRRLIGSSVLRAGDDAARLLRLIADEFPDPAIANEAREALKRLERKPE